MKTPQNIVITGASSGLGAALALHYARPGITLQLHGRHEERLKNIALECENKGAAVWLKSGDVTNAEDMKDWLVAIDVRSPIDLVIANAGISAGTGFKGESAAQAEHIFAVNVGGVINTIQPLMERMIERKRGQLAVVSSLAGIRGLPSSPAYSASKASVRVYGEGLRGWLKPFGVELSVICPGFVKTPMTDINPYGMPFMMTAEKAAAIIARGLEQDKARIAFPWQLYWPLWLVSCLPTGWTDPLFARLPNKPSL